MFRLFAVFIFFISSPFCSQQVSGIITDDEENHLSGVMIFNVNTQQKSYSDKNGKFSIEAVTNHELRFVRKGFDRSSKIVWTIDFSQGLKIILKRTIAEIEEVEIKSQPTGNLTKDAQNHGDTKQVAKLKNETANYILAKSAPEVLAAKPGEFVQPKNAGFAVGAPDSKWDDVDFMKFLISNIDEEFFTEDLQLKESEIQSFVYYIFRNFERKDILFYGVCTQADLSRFMIEAYSKLDPYRKNLPNNLPKKSKEK